MIDDFFAGQNDLFSRESSFLHDAEVSPGVRVPIAIGSLHMKNRYIRRDRFHG